MKTNPIQFLKSDKAVLAVLVLALLAQMPHAQYVFFHNGHGASWFDWLIAWGYAVALEMAVLVFVIRSAKYASWGFAAYSVLINVSYYFDLDFYPVLLLSIGLPLAIALYSHEIADTDSIAHMHGAAAYMRKQEAHSVHGKQSGSLAHTADDTHKDARSVQVNNARTDDDSTDDALDELDMQILHTVRDGAVTSYAISKELGKAPTTLRRKGKDGTYMGRLPKLADAGYLHDNDGQYALNGRASEVL